MLTPQDVIDVCLVYDARVSEDGVLTTIEAVDGESGLDEETFYLWLVVMFGDCSVQLGLGLGLALSRGDVRRLLGTFSLCFFLPPLPPLPLPLVRSGSSLL